MGSTQRPWALTTTQPSSTKPTASRSSTPCSRTRTTTSTGRHPPSSPASLPVTRTTRATLLPPTPTVDLPRTSLTSPPVDSTSNLPVLCTLAQHITITSKCAAAQHTHTHNHTKTRATFTHTHTHM